MIHLILANRYLSLTFVAMGSHQGIGWGANLVSQSTTHLGRGFFETAVQYPDRPALSIDGDTVSYRRLGMLAWGLAQQLPDTPDLHLTAVLGQRSLTAYTGVLASLLAGHGYVPLNPEFPVQRLCSMLARSKCRGLIVDLDSLPLLPELLQSAADRITVILPSSEPLAPWQERFSDHHFRAAAAATALPQTLPERRGELAYLLFTSGSTGQPKGVMVSHQNACHFIASAQARYQLGPEDRVSQNFALTFDLSVFDLFLAWGAGACVCVPQSSELIKPGNYINRERLSLWFSVPSTALFMKKFGELKEAKYPTLKWSLFCGEALSEEIAERWQQAAPSAILENLYGPTELTIACTVHRRSKDRSAPAGSLVPIGEPLPGMRERIVDASLQDVPIGTQGELLMTGPQLTLGYLDDPERNQQTFIAIPDCEELYYRTGDSVRRPGPNQPLEYMGRLDNQIQVNGFRVELGEIETCLKSQPGIDEAVACGWPITASGVGGIVAFVLGSSIDNRRLLESLRAQLPSYMAPSRIKTVERYPLNSNGKIDRHALLASLKDPAR